MGWKTDSVYGFSEILSLFNSHEFYPYFLDVNTEIEVLKATVVKVINKPRCTLLNLKLIYFACIDDQGRTTCLFWL